MDAGTPPDLLRWRRAHDWFRHRCLAVLDALAAHETVPRAAVAELLRALARHSACEERNVFARLLPAADAARLVAEHGALAAPVSSGDDDDDDGVGSLVRRILHHLRDEEDTVDAAIAASASAACTSAVGAPADAAVAQAAVAFPPPGSGLRSLALAVLREHDADAKAAMSLAIARAYADGEVVLEETPIAGFADAVLGEPARPAAVREVEARSLRSAARSVRATIHAVVHAESYAIDLTWDIIARFGWAPDTWTLGAAGAHGGGNVAADAAAACSRLPSAFFDDWVRVAAEEATHFCRWRDRLVELGGSYGELDAHAMLWEAAQETSSSLVARLAIVHCVHEARGLDVAPTFAARLAAARDPVSARILERNLAEEVTHVACGRRWLQAMCVAAGVEAGDVPAVFQSVVRRLHRGGLRGPFNTALRDVAGLTREWWAPLVTHE